MFVAVHCDTMRIPAPDPWAIIFAGGDGLRLRSLTQRIAGDGRPKQFCGDWGHPSRVVTTLRRTGREPTWLEKAPLAARA